MVTIVASVGERGRNRREDVLKIQKLLNRHLEEMGRVHPIAQDSDIGPITIRTIRRFQKRVVGMLNPDGRVDPGGQTLKALNRTPLRFVQLARNDASYYSISPASKQWGTRKTIASIRAAAREFHRATGLRIGIGNISLRRGGRLHPHRSHRIGVDVDVRPLRGDDREIPVTIHNSRYSRTQTRKLVRIVRRDGNLKFILFNDTEIAGVSPASGHHNHLHIRFEE